MNVFAIALPCLAFPITLHHFPSKTAGKNSSSPNPGSPLRLRRIFLVTNQKAPEKVERKPKARSTMATTRALRTAELEDGEMI